MSCICDSCIHQEVCEYRVSADYLDFKKCSDFMSNNTVGDMFMFVTESERCRQNTWRELHAGDFFFDFRCNWYGLKLSDHRYFNFSTNKVYGVNNDFFDVPAFNKAQFEKQLVFDWEKI